MSVNEEFVHYRNHNEHVQEPKTKVKGGTMAGMWGLSANKTRSSPGPGSRTLVRLAGSKLWRSTLKKSYKTLL